MSKPAAGGAHRSLGLASGIALVVANMVGAGVFTTSGYALAGLSRSAVLWAWLVGGVLATCGALCYGALGRRYPHSGGEYELLRRTVHPLAGFLAGWVSLFAGFSAPIASAASGLGHYLGTALGLEFATPDESLWFTRWVGTLAILLAGSLHLGGVRLGTRVQDLSVLVKLLLIGGLIVFGAFVILGRDPASAPLPVEEGTFSWPAFGVTCVYVSFAYSGWNAAVYIAGEVRDAERLLPRILLGGTLLVAAVYVALNAVFVWSAPVEELAGKAEVGLLSARALGGQTFGLAVAAVVVLALFTSVLAMTMIGPRVYRRMAEDGVFPGVFARGGAAHRPAVLLQVALALLFLWIGELQDLIQYVGYTLSLSTAAAVLGLCRIRLREGAERVPIPGWPVVPLVFVVAVLAIAAFSFVGNWRPATWSLGTLLVGALVWRCLPAARVGQS